MAAHTTGTVRAWGRLCGGDRCRAVAVGVRSRGLPWVARPRAGGGPHVPPEPAARLRPHDAPLAARLPAPQADPGGDLRERDPARRPGRPPDAAPGCDPARAPGAPVA